MSTEDIVSEIPQFVDTPDLERRVRSREAETSWTAARITRSQAALVCSTVREIIAERGPMTDDEIYAAYVAAGGKRTAQRVRTARAELAHPKAGEPVIREHPIAGRSAAGHTARRWVIA